MATAPETNRFIGFVAWVTLSGSYPPEKSALRNIALEWMLIEAKDKGLLIDEVNDRTRH